LGIVIFPHGAQKVLGWFGGGGIGGTIAFFDQAFGIPAFLTILVMIAEFFGSLGLIVGFLTRIAAAGIGLVMLGAVFILHIKIGFFMNWAGTQQGEGFEYHILALGIVIALLLAGGGRASLDGVLQRRWYPAGLSPAV
jgi:putative oxidoreductase